MNDQSAQIEQLLGEKSDLTDKVHQVGAVITRSFKIDVFYL